MLGSSNTGSLLRTRITWTNMGATPKQRPVKQELKKTIKCTSVNASDILSVMNILEAYNFETARQIDKQLEMWANAQCDGRPAEYRWRPLFNAAKFG